MQETKIQQEERKKMYISYVLAHARGVRDKEPIIKEAALKWEKNNPEIFQELNSMWKMRG